MADASKINLLGLTRSGMEAYFADLGAKAFHGRNVLKWIHKHGVTDFDAMTDVPQKLRDLLKDRAEIRVRADSLRRIVWNHEGRTYQPGTLFTRDGRRIDFRAVRWDLESVTVLTRSGRQTLRYEDMSELNLPQQPTWREMIKELALLDPVCKQVASHIPAGTLQVEVLPEGPYLYIVFDDGAISVGKGVADRPIAKMIFKDLSVVSKQLSGELDPFLAVAEGDITIRGQLPFADSVGLILDRVEAYLA